jgi:hypothetical protein
MLTLKAEYKGYDIEYNDYGKLRIIQDNEEMKTGLNSVGECERWIDARLKQKFKRIKVIFLGGYGSVRTDRMRYGEATSIVDTDYVWIISGGKRSKERITTVYLDTEENRKKLQEIAVKEMAIKAIESDISTIYVGMRITPDMMKEEV